MDMDLLAMNDAQLEALISTTQLQRTNPAARKVAKTRAAKTAQGKPPPSTADLGHLL